MAYCESDENNVLYHSYKFFTRTQGANEPFEDYLTAIYELVIPCQFDNESRMIRDRIISGINDEGLRENLFAEGNLQLNQIVQLCRAFEIDKARNGFIYDLKEEAGNSHATSLESGGVKRDELYELEPGKGVQHETSVLNDIGKRMDNNAQNVNTDVKRSDRLKKRKQTVRRKNSYECELCGKSFYRADHLQRHKTTHTGETPFGCTVCLKRFRRMDHLNRHKMTHSGGKPYECIICNRKFFRKENLTEHHKKGC